MTYGMLQPLVAWMLLALLVALRLAVLRIRDFNARRLSPQSFALRDGRQRLADATERASDHYQNQFEMPVVFVAACLTVHVAGLVDLPYLVIAWAWVALRVIHTAIHLTYNRVYHRFLVFVASAGVLIVLVVRVGWQVFFRGVQ